MFWGRFEDLCKNIGKAPNAVAKEIGVPSGSVTAWKKGSTPRNETLVKIASYFDVTVDYLSGSEQKENPTVSGEVNGIDIDSWLDRRSDAELLDIVAKVTRIMQERK